MENLNAEQVKSDLAICALGDCQACHYNKFIAGCRDELCGDALALINSQEQRIKELAEENERLRVDVLVEPLKMVTKITSYLKSLLTKGYPIVTYEFIDRLEKKMLGGHKDPVGDKGIRIDQIAKEMLEGVDNE